MITKTTLGLSSGLWPPLALALVTTGICWRLLTGPYQFAINDLGPFGPTMVGTCVLTYDPSGLGRENWHTIPSYCSYGGMSFFLGGVIAQHLFLIGCVVTAALSMFYLLRRIGNPTWISIIGALVYELSPVMLSFQQSGEGLLVTAALLPAVLVGTVETPRSSPVIDGARSGAFLAVISYANPQVPTLAILLLLPAIAGMLLRRSPGRMRTAILFCGAFALAFLLAAVPVLLTLPGFDVLIKSSQSVLQSDLAVRLAHNALGDFFTPYLLVGALPSLAALLLLPIYRDVHPSERGAAFSFAFVLALWQSLRWIGPTIASYLPTITLYKDFIKLELVLAIPVAILSATTLRWAMTLQLPRGWLGHAGRFLLVGGSAGLILSPLLFGTQTQPPYTTNPPMALNGQALLSGQLGLPTSAQVPDAYTNVLGDIQRASPDTRSYRVLWMPIDWRLWQFSRATDVNLLLFHSDAPSESQQITLSTFRAVVTGERETIAAHLAEAGVKYVVVDLSDGQDRNLEPWQTGPPVMLDVFGTQVLAGKPERYKQILANSPGLSVVDSTPGWVVYRNLEWRPIVHPFSALLFVSDTIQPFAGESQSAYVVPLLWSAGVGVHWRPQANQTIQIDAPTNSSQPKWAVVTATFSVTAGASYRISGEMDYTGVVQSHAKIVWSGGVAASNATTYLATGLDGTGAVSLAQTIVAPVGATTAVVALMGGWSQGGGGATRYVGVSVQRDVVPNLANLSQRPDLLLSLWHELPNFQIETAQHASVNALGGVQSFYLSDSAGSSATQLKPVRLLTTADLDLPPGWAVNAVPDRLGLEHFSSSAGSPIVLPPQLLRSAAPGSSVAWIEYKSGATEPTSGNVHNEPTSSDRVNIGCATISCTVANIMLLPPVAPGERATRVGYAFSPLLRTPNDHRSPTQLAGDWASVYYPSFQGYPSALYDTSSVLRAVALAFGYLAAFAGLILGVIRRR